MGNAISKVTLSSPSACALSHVQYVKLLEEGIDM
jgi:hypothetical protein